MSFGAAAEVLSVNFNQDASSLAVGTRTGYRLYSISNGEELQLVHEASTVEDVWLVERLFSSSLVTLVSVSAPRKLRVCHFHKGTEICSHSYANTILAVKLNRFRVVVCLEESLFIHNIRDMKVLHTIRETPPNTRGVCDLTPGDVSYLAYPGSSATGQLQIFDAANLASVTTIAAHDGPLAAVRFTKNGDKVATASEKGTVIRVFAVPAGERLFEFRRGVKRCVTIYSLAFSDDGLFVCSSSNTETVHVFSLDPRHKHTHEQHVAHRTSDDAAAAGGWMDYVSRTASQYLPSHMTDILQQDRSFATARLPVAVGGGGGAAASGAPTSPTAGAASVAQGGAAASATAASQSHGAAAAAAHCDKRTQLAIATGRGGQLRLMVASTDGYLYVYNMDVKNGGECALLRQHRYIQLGSAGAGGGGGGDSSDADPMDTGEAPEKAMDSALSAVAEPGAAAQIRLSDSHEFPPISHSAN